MNHSNWATVLLISVSAVVAGFTDLKTWAFYMLGVAVAALYGIIKHP